VVRYRAALRRALRRRARAPEVDFLNITAMLDLMTILLVFMLKTMTANAATIPPSDDLRLPASTVRPVPTEEGVVVVVSRSQILVGDDPNPVLLLPGRAQLAQTGAGAQYKRNGPNDLYLVPLGNALAHARETDKAVRRARGQSTESSEALLVVDGTTPYRLLVEVLFTLGQNDFGIDHLLVMSTRKG
jgi:biopolymer transport protein ExbD